MSKPIYLDYQASTPLDPAVGAAMLPYIGRHGSSVGRPVHLKVRIAATGFDCVSTDDVGEVEVNGPSLMLGYIDGPAHPIGVDGWMKTGDVGRFDSLGWLHLAGRLPGAG